MSTSEMERNYPMKKEERESNRAVLQAMRSYDEKIEKYIKDLVKAEKKTELTVIALGLSDLDNWKNCRRDEDHIALIVRFGKEIGKIIFKIITYGIYENAMIKHIDIDKKYQNKGYGARALRQLCNDIAAGTGVKRFAVDSISKQSYRCVKKAFPQCEITKLKDIQKVSARSYRMMLTENPDELQDTVKNSHDFPENIARISMFFDLSKEQNAPQTRNNNEV